MATIDFDSSTLEQETPQPPEDQEDNNQDVELIDRYVPPSFDSDDDDIPDEEIPDEEVPDEEVPDESTGSNSEQSDIKTRIANTRPGEIIPGTWGFRRPRPGIGGFFQDAGQDLKESLAPAIGVLDTITDFINFASAGGPDIPKIPEYESKQAEAIRDISGLIIPALGLRSKIIQLGARAHASKTAVPWLQKLGNRKSFEWLARFGADIGSGALVDYVAKQNQEDHNLAGTLKKYWPRTYQWIPDRIATNDSDSPEVKRSKNVNEGAIFGMLSSIVEGFAFITKASRSTQNTARFIGVSDSASKELNKLAKDEFSDIKFSDNPVEDSILRNTARKEKELDLLGEYYLNKGEVNEPKLGIHDVFDETETLVRTKDPDGILGAAIDAAQIQNNIGTSWGRLGNIVHEAARKNGLELENLTNRTLVSDLAEQIKKAKRFGKKLNSGKHITDKMVDDAGRHLAATLLHPQIQTKDILSILDEFKRSIEGSAVRIAGKKGINRAVKELTQQLIDIDIHKARAYLVTSEAGQISDMAEGARLMDEGLSIPRTVEAMADRLEVLMVEKGLAQFEANSMLSNMQSWKAAAKSGDKDIMTATADVIVKNHSEKLLEIIPEAKRWTSTIKDVANNNPGFLKSLLLASEMADGNVDTLYKLHKWAGSDSLGIWNKSIVDFNPDTPSILNQVAFSNIFNSMLSSIRTPLKAAAGNLTGLLGKATSTFAGHLVTGDFKRLQEAFIAHWAFDDTLQNASNYMRLVFRKASTNPHEFKYLTRSDIALKEVKGMEVLRAYAEGAEANGEFGPSALLRLYDDLDAIAADPVLRFSSNGMTALDGFTKHINSASEAKYRALWKLKQQGVEFTEESFREAYGDIHSKMFNSDNIITDSAVDIATREIALNADTPMVKYMNNMMKHVPIFRSIVYFPRTTANVLKTFGDWSPAGILAKDHHQLWGPLGRKKLEHFTRIEIEDFLTTKGIEIDENYMEQFIRLRAEVKGKAAIGSVMMTMVGFAAMNDRCTGNGHHNPAIQRQRIQRGWKAKSCKVPGTNKYVSYDWMGPLGDWLSTSIDLVDNFDSLSTTHFEDGWNKLMWVFASAYTNRNNLAAFEPLHDVLQGNGAAAIRWSSSFLNNAIPLGAARMDAGKIINNQLRIVRNDFSDAVRNRNTWLDVVDPNNAMPGMVDYIDGKKVGYDENWLVRALKTWSPVKLHDAPSPIKQWLIDIEYDNSPKLRVSQNGALLEPKEIATIHTIMGEQGVYSKGLKRIKTRADNLEFEGIRGFANIIKAQRNGQISSDILANAKFAGIFDDLDALYARARRLAENSLPEEMRLEIRERELVLRRRKLFNKNKDLNRLYELEGLEQTLSIPK